MRLSSPAFEPGATIPQNYGRNFANVNPPLFLQDVPVETLSLILIMEDPDVPATAGVPVWDHWIVFNIPPQTREIPEAWRPIGVSGNNTRGELVYGGPRPPDREHRYFFRVHALDHVLDLSVGSSKHDVLTAADGHIIASAELMGRFAP